MGIDLCRVDAVHRVRVVSLAEVEALNRRDLAMFAIANREPACQSVMLSFDTEAEAEAYGRGHLGRTRLRDARRAPDVASADEDPCAAIADAPDFRPDDAAVVRAG